ncbi:protein of unknown function [Burkholderia multivorans]
MKNILKTTSILADVKSEILETAEYHTLNHNPKLHATFSITIFHDQFITKNKLIDDPRQRPLEHKILRHPGFL